MKLLTLKLTQLETSYGEVVGIKNTLTIQVPLGKGNYEKLKNMLQEGDDFSISIESELDLDAKNE